MNQARPAPRTRNPIATHATPSDIEVELGRVEDIIDDVVARSWPAHEVIEHLVGAGGKRTRPVLTLLSYAMLAPRHTNWPLHFAAAAELVHTATLLHDDVIDESTLRRGRPTACSVWSNSASVLAGDHCLASAVELIREHDTGDILAEALATVKDLVAGELLQLQNQQELSFDEERYRQICNLKTTSLFVWCARAGAYRAGARPEQLECVSQVARSLGEMFQIADDLGDVIGGTGFGKNTLADLKQGKITFPLLFACQESASFEDDLRALYDAPHSTNTDWERLRLAIGDTGAIDATLHEIHTLMSRGLDSLHRLPNNAYRLRFEEQLRLIVHRVTV